MNTKNILAFLLFAVVIFSIGVMFKFMHWPGASVLILVGTLLKVLAAFMLIAKLVLSSSVNEALKG